MPDQTFLILVVVLMMAVTFLPRALPLQINTDHWPPFVARALGGTLLGSGIGLRNLRERLAALHGGRAAFELRTGSCGWTEAELALPLASRALA